MKKFHLRSFFWGINLGGVVLLLLLVLFLTKGFFDDHAVTWPVIIGVGGFCAGGMLLLNFLLLSVWIRPSLRELSRLASLSAFAPHSGGPQSRIADFSYVEQQLRAQHSSLQAALRKSRQTLNTNGSEADSTISVEQTIEDLNSSIRTAQCYIGEIIERRLTTEIQGDFQRTELGRALHLMTTGLHNTLEKLRKHIKHISLVSAKIGAMSEQGARNATFETQVIEQISAAIYELVDKLKEVKLHINNQGDGLEQTFTDIEKLLASIRETNQTIELLSTLAENTSRAISAIHDFMQEIEEHAQSLDQISGTITTEASDGVQSVDAVISGIHTIETMVKNAAAVIQQLGSESSRIEEIVEVIDEVTEHTNLLSLNASIIAAQAGEHGRGFAVVAGEIRELAERTKTSTKEIEAIIRSFQNKIRQGTSAMNQCLEAVSDGVEVANRSGTILQKIAQSIQGAKAMASNLANATVTQTQNSQQVTQATEQLSRKLEELYTSASEQSQSSTHLAEMANVLKDAMHHIEELAAIQLQNTDTIAQSVGRIEELLHRNARISQQLENSSSELGMLESELAIDMGQFFVSSHQRPDDFDPNRPTIAIVFPCSANFFTHIYHGIRQELAAHQFQGVAFNAFDNPVLQAEHMHWLRQQSWLKGVVMIPVDKHMGSSLVTGNLQSRIITGVVDRPVENANVLVLSDNECGGKHAADSLRESIPAHSTVLVLGTCSIHSIFQRMEGFRTQAEQYQWNVVQFFSPSIDDIEQSKQDILDALALNPEAKGIFLTAENLSLGYLELLREEILSSQALSAITYDTNPGVIEAITHGDLIGTIDQTPEQLGRRVIQEILAVLDQPSQGKNHESQRIIVPIKVVSRANVAEYTAALTPAPITHVKT